MKRYLLIAAIFLLGGAVVNVAVAWGCALWIDIEGFSQFAAGRPLQQYEYAGWYVYIRRHQGAVRIERFVQEPGQPYESTTSPEPPRGLPLWSRAHDPPIWPPTGPLYDTEDAHGWPLYSLHCKIDSATIVIRQSDPDFIQFLDKSDLSPEDLSSVLAPGDSVSGGLLLCFDVNELRALPFRPLWPGFAVNTLFYVIVLWLLSSGPFALRRIIRIRRGLCPKCAYPMGGSAVCSECGKELPCRVKGVT